MSKRKNKAEKMIANEAKKARNVEGIKINYTKEMSMFFLFFFGVLSFFITPILLYNAYVSFKLIGQGIVTTNIVKMIFLWILTLVSTMVSITVIRFLLKQIRSLLFRIRKKRYKRE